MHNEFAPQVFLSPPAPPALHSYYKLYSNQIQTATITMANQLNADAAAAGMLIGSFSQYTLVQYRKTREMTGSLHVAIAYHIGITTFPQYHLPPSPLITIATTAISGHPIVVHTDKYISVSPVSTNQISVSILHTLSRSPFSSSLNLPSPSHPYCWEIALLFTFPKR